MSPLYRFGKGLLSPFFRVLYRYRLINGKNLPPEGQFILCCNHISLKDPIFLAMGQKRQVHYMAKAELFQNRIFAKVITALGAFPVHRGEGDHKAIHTAENLLQQGQMLGIFIEGTRSRTGELLRPKSGAAMLAYASGAPVVPACISCKGGKKPKIFRRVTVSFGEPLSVRDLGLVEGTGAEFRNASRKIMECIQALRNRDIAVH